MTLQRGRRIPVRFEDPSGEMLAAHNLLAASPAHADVIYVDDSATGANDGTSWRDAFVDLQDALAVATLINVVYVAEGVYRPTSTGDRDSAFVIDGKQVYGGFDGTETTLAERAELFEQTVLTGDLAGDDRPGFRGYDENSYHIVVARHGRLDGFRIEGGSAVGNGLLGVGGGIYAPGWGFSLYNCTLARNLAVDDGGGAYGELFYVVDCRFEDNRAGGDGGGMGGGGLWFERCTFLNNRAAGRGGAVFAGEGNDRWFFDSFFEGNHAKRSGGALFFPEETNPLVRGCRFERNRSRRDGGAVYFASVFADLQDSTFVGNAASGSGGGVFQQDCSLLLFFFDCVFLGNTAHGLGGGGLAMRGSCGYGELVNLVFSGNRATNCSLGGGGLLIWDSWNTRVTNCTFSGNRVRRASEGGGGMLVASRSASVRNTIYWENEDDLGSGYDSQFRGNVSVSSSCVQGWTPERYGNNMGADPRFVDAVGEDGVVGSADDDLRLDRGSPCVDTGQGACPGYCDGDAGGEARIVDALDCDGLGVLDMGAYERQEIDVTTNYCVATPSSLGVPAIMDATCVVRTGEFTLSAGPVPEGFGSFFLGTERAERRFGGGAMCVGGHVLRLTPVRSTAGTVTQDLDLSDAPLAGVVLPGSQWHFQAVFRDPGSAYGSGLSDAVSVTFLAP